MREENSWASLNLVWVQQLLCWYFRLFFCNKHPVASYPRLVWLMCFCLWPQKGLKLRLAKNIGLYVWGGLNACCKIFPGITARPSLFLWLQRSACCFWGLVKVSPHIDHKNGPFLCEVAACCFYHGCKLSAGWVLLGVAACGKRPGWVSW